jgi:hypothetical protein
MQYHCTCENYNGLPYYGLQRKKNCSWIFHFLMYNAYSFTSIVGFPRESKILRAKHFRIGIIVAAKFAGYQPPEKRRDTKNALTNYTWYATKVHTYWHNCNTSKLPAITRLSWTTLRWIHIQFLAKLNLPWTEICVIGLYEYYRQALSNKPTHLTLYTYRLKNCPLLHMFCQTGKIKHLLLTEFNYQLQTPSHRLKWPSIKGEL